MRTLNTTTLDNKMSHQVKIDYEQIAVQCNSVCEVAESQLKALDAMIEKIESNSSTLLNEQTAALKRQIEKEKAALQKQIETVRKKAEEDAKRGVVSVDNERTEYQHRNDSINAANELRRQIDMLASQKMVEYEGLLSTLLLDSIQSNYQKLLNQGNGVVTVDDALTQFLDGIEDETLRQFTYIAYLQNTSLRGEALLEAGRALVGKTYEARLEEERSRIREKLKAARVEASTIEEVTKASGGTAKEQIAAMQEAATTEIVGEKVRQKSLKIIMQAIKARGFVVDKNNIKIKRDTNEVVMVAQKASGEKAEFRVFLDGKFIYDFRGYEGQACQKDIGPFMKDLEEVYGVHVTKQTEIWSNPDKISTMKYQAINTNKNKA